MFKRILKRKKNEKPKQEEEVKHEPPKQVSKLGVVKAAHFHIKKTPEQLLESLPEGYFKEDFDPVRHMLQQCPNEVNERFLEDQMSELDCIKDVISEKLCREVMANSSSFVQGMTHVRDVQIDLSMTALLIKNSRRLLSAADEDLAHSVLQILFRQRRHDRLSVVHRLLCTMMDLMKEENNVQSANFSEAILAFQRCAGQYGVLKRLACLSSLQARLDVGKDAIMEKMIETLMGCCTTFDSARVMSVVKAYILMGEAKHLGSVLKKCFLDAVDKFPHKVLMMLLARSTSANEATVDAYRKLPFDRLCSEVTTGNFRACYVGLLRALVGSMHSFVKMMELLDKLSEDREQLKDLQEQSVKCRQVFAGFHGSEGGSTIVESASVKESPALNEKSRSLSNHSSDASGQAVIEEMQESLRLVCTELNSVRQTLFSRAQRKATVLLSCAYLTTTTMGMAELLTILNSTYKFKALGEVFISRASHVTPREGTSAAVLAEPLNKTMMQKMREYVNSFRLQRFEELRESLNVEEWQALPLSAGFHPMRDIASLRKMDGLSVYGSSHPAAMNRKGSVPHFRFPLVDFATREGMPTVQGGGSGELSALCSAAELRASVYSSLRADLYELMCSGEDVFGEEEQHKRRTLEEEEEEEASIEQTSPAPATSGKGDEKEWIPVMTSSSFLLARFIGRYMSLMDRVRPMSLESFFGLCELFDYFLYSVFNLFGVGAQRFFEPHFDNNLYPRLRVAVNAIRERIDRGLMGFYTFNPEPPPGSPPPKAAATSDAALPPAKSTQPHLPTFLLSTRPQVGMPMMSLANKKKEPKKLSSSRPSMRFRARKKVSRVNGANTVHLVKLSPKVDLVSKANLFGLIERYVATECLRFLVYVLRQLEMRLALLLPKEQQYLAAKFMTYAEEVCSEFSAYMHRNLPACVLDVDPIIEAIVGSKWEPKSLSTKHSSYVDTVLSSLKEAAAVLKRLGGLPSHLHHVFWSEVLAFLLESMLDGYSRIRKCTTEGRARMSMDLNILKAGLEKLTDVRPIPRWQHVHTWVKAYYMPTESDVLKWIQAHPGYELQHYLSIAQCGLASAAIKKRKARAEFEKRVEEAVAQHERNKNLMRQQELRDRETDWQKERQRRKMEMREKALSIPVQQKEEEEKKTAEAAPVAAEVRPDAVVVATEAVGSAKVEAAVEAKPVEEKLAEAIIEVASEEVEAKPESVVKEDVVKPESHVVEEEPAVIETKREPEPVAEPAEEVSVEPEKPEASAPIEVAEEPTHPAESNVKPAEAEVEPMKEEAVTTVERAADEVQPVEAKPEESIVEEAKQETPEPHAAIESPEQPPNEAAAPAPVETPQEGGLEEPKQETPEPVEAPVEEAKQETAKVEEERVEEPTEATVKEELGGEPSAEVAAMITSAEERVEEADEAPMEQAEEAAHSEQKGPKLSKSQERNKKRKERARRKKLEAEQWLAGKGRKMRGLKQRARL